MGCNLKWHERPSSSFEITNNLFLHEEPQRKKLYGNTCTSHHKQLVNREEELAAIPSNVHFFLNQMLQQLLSGQRAIFTALTPQPFALPELFSHANARTKTGWSYGTQLSCVFIRIRIERPIKGSNMNCKCSLIRLITAQTAAEFLAYNLIQRDNSILWWNKELKRD